MSGSFGGILSIARSALRAQQMAIEVAAQNVANAQTEGYTRARAVLNPLPPRFTPQGVLGTGVAVTDIERVRDRLLDDAFRGEAANASRHNARWEMLTRVEQLFAEPSDSGLGASLDRFADSWNDLSSSPTSAAAKQVVAQRGRQVAQWLNGADARLTQFQNESFTRLTEQVGRINTLLAQIGDLNGQIIPIEAGGGTAAPLRDQRDRMMDELAGMVGATALENADGSVNVIVAGQTMVDQGRSQAFNAPNLVSGTVRLTIGSSAEPVQVRTGSVAGLLSVYNTDLPGVRADLDAISTALVHGVNRWHRTGWTAAGDALSLAGETYAPTVPAGERGSRVDFFASPAGTVPGAAPPVTARNIRLSAEVEANTNVIAAGRGGWDGTDVVPQPGDNSIALAIAAMRTSLTMPDDADPGVTDPPAQVDLPGLGGRSIGDFWRSSVTDLGLETSRVKSDRDAGEALQQQTDTRRQAVSGVSVDEELIALSRAQQAYQAAARVLSTVQELTADLLSIAR
jgi:flagellar hook-associated protein 1